MEGEEVNIDELAANLSTYKDQLQQVRFKIYTFLFGFILDFVRTRVCLA